MQRRATLNATLADAEAAWLEAAERLERETAQQA
jgi:hypothetical protein